MLIAGRKRLKSVGKKENTSSLSTSKARLGSVRGAGAGAESQDYNPKVRHIMDTNYGFS